MEEIEKRNIAPINPQTRIDETDTSRVQALLRRQLADILTGNQSYFPDGVQMDQRARLTALRNFVLTVDSLRQNVDDPSNVLGKAVEDLRSIAKRVGERIDESEPVDNIQLPPHVSPTTRDNNVIYVDPEGGPFAPPNPVREGRKFRNYRASFDTQSEPMLGLVSGKPMPMRPIQPPLFFPR